MIRDLLSHAQQMQQLGDISEAEMTRWCVLRVYPDNSEPLHLIGTLHAERGNYWLASTLLRQAIALDPGNAVCHYDLGSLLVASGQIELSLASLRRAVELRPEYHRALYMAQYYASSCDPRTLSFQVRRWVQRFADLLTPATTPVVDPNSSRNLCIGYISGELRSHPIGCFLEPRLLVHDRLCYEVCCYSNSPRADALTHRLRLLSDRWRDVWSLTDSEFCKLVRLDGIDILVDLSWHLGVHRLLVFACRQAPVQMTWLGACGTTGMRAIDYLIADEHLCPPDSDGLYTEKVISLPRFYLPCGPLAGLSQRLPTPKKEGGVFDYFNRPSKIGPEVLDLWARIMLALPQARLCLRAATLQPSTISSRLAKSLEVRGMASERLELIGQVPKPDLLAAYSGIDIALDNLPHGGCTTSIEALWTGVSVITLEGEDIVGRTSSYLLRWAGLQELMVRSSEEYLDTALRLGRDLVSLSCLRADLRSRLESTSLADHEAFTRELERAYRRIWRGLCQDVIVGQGNKWS